MHHAGRDVDAGALHAVIEFIADLGGEAMPMSSADFGKFIQADA